ncbi:MAG: hypothetical protein GF372_12080 [Candidatus Marinimicrobia bacterium]|nr:hypothetical protein [Candidatus Neomarinimicrobiota bacterium]
MKKTSLLLVILFASSFSLAVEHPRVDTAASSSLSGWPGSSSIDCDPGTSWSSEGSPTTNYQWIAFWFDKIRPTDYIRFRPRYHNGSAVCVPEEINIYYSSGTSWEYIKTVSLSSAIPETGTVINFSSKNTNGIMITSDRLRPEGSVYYFQASEIYAGTTSCSSFNSLDASYEWCTAVTSYHINRPVDSDYLTNSHVRVGVNRNFGGTIFELYKSPFVDNLILEHGGGAIQLSLWGYNGSENEIKCAEVFGNLPVYPWNPIQAQCYNCDWETAENDADIQFKQANSYIYSEKTNPGQFSLKGPFEDLTWSQNVSLGTCWVEINYNVLYNGTLTISVHPQEMPAIFPAWGINDNFSYYSGAEHYEDPSSSITTLIKPEKILYLPNRDSYPHSTNYYETTEHWVSVSDIDQEKSITVATFSPLVKEFAINALDDGGGLGHGYITPIGDFNIYPGLDINFTVYIFPYKYDDVVDGKSVRQWIYDLRPDKQPPTGTVWINSDAAYTNSTSVTLTLSATDDSGTISQIRFSNDNNNWSSWQPYEITKNWTLSDGNGTRYVYVQFSDVIGNISASYSDSIILDATKPTGSITIDSDNSVTFYPAVNLALSASDSGSGVSQMRFYTLSTGWSNYETYSTLKSMTLSSGFGSKTVYVQYKDVAGNTSSVYNDSIYYTVKGDFVATYQVVDLSDFAYLAEHWLDSCGQDHCQAADINLDGKVNLEDLAEMALNW